MAINSNIISVVTSAFKADKFIEETIESVLSQQGNFYLDYVIFDGNSPDDTLKIVESYARLLHGNCQIVEYQGQKFYRGQIPNTEFNRCLGISFRYVSEPDRGQYDGINKGIELAFGDIFGYLNSDDIYEPGCLQAVVQYFEQYQQTDVIYGNGLYIDEDSNIFGIYKSYRIDELPLSDNCYISQPSGFTRMKAVREVGGFNIAIRNSADYEFWLRLQSKGKKFMHVRDVLSSTRIHLHTKTSLNRAQIQLEVFAITKHYAGTVPFRWKQEFALESTLISRGLDFGAQVWQKLRRAHARLYARFYGRNLLKQVDREERRIFGSNQTVV